MVPQDAGRLTLMYAEPSPRTGLDQKPDLVKSIVVGEGLGIWTPDGLQCLKLGSS